MRKRIPKMMKHILPILIVGSAILYSCSDSERDGDWDDNIKLSTKTVELKSTADSVTIKTVGEWWWVASISIADKHYYDFGIDTDSYPYAIQAEDVVFKRVNKNTILIKVQENPLQTNRIINVSLQAGDYFDGIRVTQKSNP